MPGERRGQSNLIALAIAILLLTAAIGVALTIAGAPFHTGAPTAADRHLARGAAATLLAGDSPLTRRAGVLNASALRAVDGADLRELLGLGSDVDVRLRFDGRTVAATGRIERGATVRRVVTVTQWQWTRTDAAFGNDSSLMVGPTPVVKLGVNASSTTIQSVRVDGRVVLHAPTGVSTPVTIAVPQSEPVQVNVTTTGPGSSASIWVATPTVATETGVLVVTIDG